MEAGFFVILIISGYWWFLLFKKNLIEVQFCTVQHSSTPVIVGDFQFVCGGMIFFFLLDVCHVDKSVAGVEYMNNPWSQDVYSASWSWEAIIQLQLFCHTPADCLEIA